MDVSEHFAVLLRALEKEVLQKQEELGQFRMRADQYCQDQEAEITKALAHIEIIRTQMREWTTESLVDKPFTPTAEEKSQPALNVTQSDRVRNAAKVILRDAGEPVMQLELKKRMEAKGIFIHARNPVDLIRAALRRGPEFKHIHNQGWTLKDADA